MLAYEHERTERIVDALTRVARPVRFFSILAGVALGAAAVGLFGAALDPGAAGPFALFGAALGFLVGSFLGSLARVGLEWMAQVLVAQGEIVAGTKRRG